MSQPMNPGSIPFATSRDRAAWLKHVPVFRDAELETLELYAAAMTDRMFAAGEVLCQQGERNTEVFVIVAGDTEIQVTQDGRCVAKDRVLAGNCVGEMAVLTGQSRSATVIAGNRGASVIVIAGPHFRNLLLVQPAVGVNMLSVLGQRLRQTEVRKRNAELARRLDEMVHSVAESQAALRARSDFLAGVSHEIRTPLNGMIGLTEMVLDTSLTTAQRDYLNLIRDSGESLLALINDLLDFSKIEAGQMDLESQPFALRDQLGDALKPIALRAHRKGLELGFRVRPDVPDILVGDSLRLRQVIVNLVGNAIKFTESGDVLVDVQLADRADSTVFLQFSVRDTGVGIPRERLATIFEPYTQADASIARRFGGTGLGLSISTRLVDRMGGELHVESQLGRGSTFHFTVPFAAGSPEAPAGRDEVRRFLQGTRALVIEPHISTRQTLAEILDDFGLKTTAVNDGLEFSAAISSAMTDTPAYDVVVVDAKAPECQSIIERFRHQGCALAIMLVTSDQLPERMRCDELQIPHLMKPVKSQELWDAITSTASLAGAPSFVENVELAAEIGLAPRYRVLLAEDNLINQMVAKNLLEKEGHKVVTAADGREAVAAATSQAFDVVLMDMLMPQMDGLEATAAIRAREKKHGGHVPIIAMTAHSVEDEGQRCLAAGMDAFLSKPVRAQTLFSTILSVVDGGGSSPQDLEALPARRVIDWPGVLQKAGDNRRLLGKIVSLVQAELPRLLAEITAAVSHGRGTELRLAAHTLKEVIRPLGPERVMEKAAYLEALGRSEEIGDASSVVAELEQETAQLMTALERFSGQEAVPQTTV